MPVCRIPVHGHKWETVQFCAHLHRFSENRFRAGDHQNLSQVAVPVPVNCHFKDGRFRHSSSASVVHTAIVILYAKVAGMQQGKLY